MPISLLAPLPVSDPHRGVRVFADYGDAPVRDRCDVLVIGSGPGGAVVAKELAEAGLDVIVLEEGPPVGPQDFVPEGGDAMQRLLREGGARASEGNLFTPTMQAIALGGGSIVNSAICARPPAWIYDKWTERTGVTGLSAEVLGPHFDRVENQLGVTATPDEVQGERNRRFKVGCDALGIHCEPIWRNVQGCLGSGECFTGCRNGAKRSVDRNYIPAAIRAGARVYTSVRAETIATTTVRGETVATGVRGRVVVPFTHDARTTQTEGDVFIEAKAVVSAAGCMATPLILLRSGFCNRWIGGDLRFHPGVAVMGIFEEKIDPWAGATQGYHALDYLQEGLKFEVLWSPPPVLATRLPGVGHAFQRHLQQYQHMAPFDVICAADNSSGIVKPRGKSWDPHIKYNFDAEDVAIMQKGLGILADICWEAGAHSILPGLHGVPEVITSRDEAEIIRTYPMKANHTVSAANHAFCTTRMSRDPDRGAVDAWGRVHEASNVFVADTGNFAASSGVNPMLLCMALSDRIASGIAAQLS
ncbi:MAG: GMC family oxidoreductase N-terminal domain-containing protein [Myxococcota bacterium]